jgi:hypothetical protein
MKTRRAAADSVAAGSRLRIRAGRGSDIPRGRALTPGLRSLPQFVAPLVLLQPHALSLASRAHLARIPPPETTHPTCVARRESSVLYPRASELRPLAPVGLSHTGRAPPRGRIPSCISDGFRGSFRAFPKFMISHICFLLNHLWSLWRISGTFSPGRNSPPGRRRRTADKRAAAGRGGPAAAQTGAPGSGLARRARPGHAPAGRRGGSTFAGEAKKALPVAAASL